MLIHELATAYQNDAEAFTKTYAKPILLGRPIRGVQRAGFRTEHVGVETHAIAPDTLHGHVFVISKRPGGTFPDQIGVGRTRAVDISLPFPQVSKYHAYFSETGPGKWGVADAGSANGTFVNRTRLEPRVLTPLGDRAVLSFAEYSFLFLTPEGLRNYVKRSVVAVDS